MDPRYELVVGLETHARLISQTKAFCGCQNAVELATIPNSNVCPVCMGFPGMLPVLSAEVVDLGVRTSHALHCTVNPVSNFDRKSYFYPDLPNGFQTTQLFHPLSEHGYIDAIVEGSKKRFRIRRIHLENDAGKLVHEGGKSLVDWNRAGSPLVEIVTEPDFRSKDDVIEYLKELQKNLRFCGGSDADMEKGQLRCDVNISVRLRGETDFRPRVELKNLNSFGAIGRAIDTEIQRQIDLYETGNTVDQETRGWDDDAGESYPMRSKEDAMDYRYFPEPDLPPLKISSDFVDARRISELPIDRRTKYLETYKLLEDDARILSEERETSDFFEEVAKNTNDPKKACSYITSVLFKYHKDACLKYGKSISFGDFVRKTLSKDIEFSRLLGEPHIKIQDIQAELSQLIQEEKSGNISNTNAKLALQEVIEDYIARKFANAWESSVLNEISSHSNLDSPKTISEVIITRNLRQVSDANTLEAIAQKVVADSPSQVEQYKAGKVNLFGFFVGQCMKASGGSGNPQMFTEILKKILG